MNALLREKRFAMPLPDHRGPGALLLKQGWWGGLAVMVIGVVAGLGGWMLQDPRALVAAPVAFCMGLWTLARDLWRRAHDQAGRSS